METLYSEFLCYERNWTPDGKKILGRTDIRIEVKFYRHYLPDENNSLPTVNKQHNKEPLINRDRITYAFTTEQS